MVNGRAAKYLGGRKGIGDYGTFVAEGIETNPNQGIVETLDLYNQTKAINPAQADALIDDVAPKLSGANRQRLATTFSAGTDNGDGSHAVTQQETKDLTVTPPGANQNEGPNLATKRPISILTFVYQFPPWDNRALNVFQDRRPRGFPPTTR